MKKYELVIFDLDGTLLDTSEGILSSVKYAIQEMGFDCPSEDVLRSFIGPPIQNSFSSTFNITGNQLDKMSELFRNHYKDVDLLKAKEYDGIFECLDKLKNIGVSCAVATYKREDYALKLLKEFHFDKYMSVMRGSDFAGRLSKADIINLVISETDVKDNSKVLMVGDTIGDGKAALDAGVDFLGVNYGFGKFDESDLISLKSIATVNKPIEIISCCG